MSNGMALVIHFTQNKIWYKVRNCRDILEIFAIKYNLALVLTCTGDSVIINKKKANHYFHSSLNCIK